MSSMTYQAVSHALDGFIFYRYKITNQHNLFSKVIKMVRKKHFYDKIMKISVKAISFLMVVSSFGHAEDIKLSDISVCR